MPDILFHLIFGQTNYLIPIDCVTELLEDHEELSDTYTITSHASGEEVDSFVHWLRNGRNEFVPREQVHAFFALGCEFGIDELMLECQAILLGRPELPERTESPTSVPVPIRPAEWSAIVRGLVERMNSTMARLHMPEVAALRLTDLESPDCGPFVSAAGPGEPEATSELGFEDFKSEFQAWSQRLSDLLGFTEDLTGVPTSAIVGWWREIVLFSKAAHRMLAQLETLEATLQGLAEYQSRAEPAETSEHQTA
jgi:hypothetical protein